MWGLLIPTENREERWKWLMSRLGPKELGVLYQEAYAILNNPDDADDVLHNALLKGFSRCHQLRDERKAFSWMVRIVRNEAYSYYRQNSLYPLRVRARLALWRPPFESSAEYLFFREQENTALREAIWALPSPERDIVTLHLLDKIPLAAVAGKLRMNYPTVRSRYRRTLKKINRMLEEYGHE